MSNDANISLGGLGVNSSGIKLVRSIPWSTVRLAIHQWVVAHSGIAEDHVIWEEQRGPQPPTGTYISLMIRDVRSFGLDWNEITAYGDGIKHSIKGPRVATLVIQCFCGGRPWFEAQPQDRLETVIASRALPSRAQSLRAAGVGFGPIGPVDALAIERSTLFEPRARVEATIHLTSAVEELNTYIESVEAEETIGNIVNVLHIGGTNAFITLDQLSFSATGLAPSLGSDSTVLDDLTFAATGTVPSVGTLSITLAALATVMEGAAPALGTESTTLDAVTQIAAGTVPIVASETSTLDDDIVIGLGTAFIGGDGLITLDDDTGTGIG